MCDGSKQTDKELSVLEQRVEKFSTRYAEAEAILKELDRTFEGRDADGAPAADGSYWLGHGMALRIWFWLHPEQEPTNEPIPPF